MIIKTDGRKTLIDKIVITPHPHKIDKDGRRHHPMPRPPARGERLTAVHEAGSRSLSESDQGAGDNFRYLPGFSMQFVNISRLGTSRLVTLGTIDPAR